MNQHLPADQFGQIVRPAFPQAKASAPASQPIHFIEIDYGRPLGRTFVEIDGAKATFAEAVRVVRAGDHHAERVVRVIAADPVAGTCKDVSRDVAKAIFDAWDEEDMPHLVLLEFLERHDLVPAYRSDDEPCHDHNAEHRIGRFEALGR